MRMANENKFMETYSRHRPIMGIYNKLPAINSSAFVAPNAAVIGDVKMASGSSVWYNAVVRGDENAITIGENTNVQDRAVVISTKKNHNCDGTCTVGNNVTIGHGAILNACSVEDYTLIGMGAVLEEGSHVGTYSMVGAGSVVEKGQQIPSGELWTGNPAKFVRKLRDEERAHLEHSASEYVELGKKSAAEIKGDYGMKFRTN
ncbi:gamma carbonic anhydrase mitochondrial-like protein [Blastocystis sp. subtype 4]|uniref:gamma carbonic anhydrase mitochondrial-like protein n=1 Tax=Blastocystis sp. subtype 4 TaxID=944170 RepID=UPI000711D604|nr:gamma carbonic anhydrase mitochondrial-like protein [Blastocystis sp. subtype 4]KNB46746.1 gamma carbonic anhydrase mitochondrial-like protein [Blastocystis sp. subtype 4]|eukprot:XP_014530189.1 gamma carbonic anhydrase mitochondrial-like protein [Blastocystis sp. subtype 4]